MPRPTPLRPSRLALACALALPFLVAGCGADDERAATGSSPAPTSSVGAPGAGNPAGGAPLDSENAPPTQATPGDEKQVGNRPDDPDLPASRGDSLETPSTGERVSLASKSGAEPAWQVLTKLGDDEFCASVNAVGPTDPTPMCGSATTTALTLAADGDGVQTSVSSIRREARQAPQDLLVWGIVEAEVEKVVVEYGGSPRTAALSPTTNTLDVDSGVTESFGDNGDTFPERVALRTFAVSVETTTGNPPTAARAKTPEPVDGVVTLVLQ